LNLELIPDATLPGYWAAGTWARKPVTWATGKLKQATGHAGKMPVYPVPASCFCWYGLGYQAAIIRYGTGNTHIITDQIIAGLRAGIAGKLGFFSYGDTGLVSNV